MVATPLTTSKNGTLYFAYGSNLSPFQMSGRCPNSGTPIAVARLNSWSWMISDKGYANLLPVRPTRTSVDTDANTVWGILYNLTPSDEAALDGYEGWSDQKESSVERGPPNPVIEQRKWKPFEQGKGTYNKLYLFVKIEKWLVEAPQATFELETAHDNGSGVRALVYVDEITLVQGRIGQAYIRRMSRAVRESIELGIPERWINNVMSQHGIDKSNPEGFTDDITPEGDAESPLRDQWESLREKYLRNELSNDLVKQ